MRVDCSTCPARNLACDGCMMNVLFGPPTSANNMGEGDGLVTKSIAGPDVEITAAVDVFLSAAMVTSESATSAREGISAGRGVNSGSHLRILRAG